MKRRDEGSGGHRRSRDEGGSGGHRRSRDEGGAAGTANSPRLLPSAVEAAQRAEGEGAANPLTPSSVELRVSATAAEERDASAPWSAAP
jgi:hypothetical protein